MLIAIYDLLLLEIYTVIYWFWSFLPFCKFMIFHSFNLSSFFSASQSVEDTVGSVRHKNCPVSLHPCARDAYLLFQVNHFEDQWMISHWFVSCFRSGRLINLTFPHLKLLRWGGYSAKFYTGRFCPGIQSLNTLLYTPFIYLLFKNGTPFAYLV